MPARNLHQPIKGWVLIADDEHRLIESVKALLRRAGYEVFTAGDARDAWELFQREQTRLHAIVTDLIMPGDWDGVDFIRHVRGVAPQTPVVLTSGYSLPGAVIDLRCALLRKPFTADALQSAIDRANALIA